MPHASTCMQSTELMTARSECTLHSVSVSDEGSVSEPTSQTRTATSKSRPELPVPFWLKLLGSRRGVFWGSEPGDLRALFTGQTGDVQARRLSAEEEEPGSHEHPALEHQQTPPLHPLGQHQHQLPHAEDHGAEALFQHAPKDPRGAAVLSHEEFMGLAELLTARAAHHSEHDHHDDHERSWLAAYKLPMQRHLWGEHQTHLDPWLGDILLDLIVVGVCYQLGDVIKSSFYGCDGSAYGYGRRLADSSPSSSSSNSSSDASSDGGAQTGTFCIGVYEGAVHACAFFTAIYRLWSASTLYRARFSTDGSAAHLALEAGTGLLLVLASHGVRPCIDHLHDDGGHVARGFLRLHQFALPAAGIIIVRHLEIGLLHPAEAARRTAGTQLVNFAGMVAFWLAAFACASVSHAQPADSAGARAWLSACAMLTTAGGNWIDVRTSYVLLRERFLRRRGYTLGALERHRKNVPMNLNFVLHRWQEFMYLMLGECLLQLVISAATTVQTQNGSTREYRTTIVAGFVAALCMAHSYHLVEPHRADNHATRRSAVSGVVFALLFHWRGFAVLCVGVGFKMALYDPHGSTIGLRQQRLTLAVPMAACFGLQMLMHPLHIGLRRYYSVATLRRHPARTLCILLRLLLIGAMMGSAVLPNHEAWRFSPWQFSVLQAGLAVAQAALLHAQLVLFGTRRELSSAGLEKHHGHKGSGRLHVGVMSARQSVEGRMGTDGASDSDSDAVESDSDPDNDEGLPPRIARRTTSPSLSELSSWSIPPLSGIQRCQSGVGTPGRGCSCLDQRPSSLGPGGWHRAGLALHRERSKTSDVGRRHRRSSGSSFSETPRETPRVTPRERLAPLYSPRARTMSAEDREAASALASSCTSSSCQISEEPDI